MPDRKIITHLTLKMLQEHLPATSFVQPHKSYQVAIDKINSIAGNTLYAGRFQVPVSKYQQEETMQKILNNRFLKR